MPGEVANKETTMKKLLILFLALATLLALALPASAARPEKKPKPAPRLLELSISAHDFRGKPLYGVNVEGDKIFYSYTVTNKGSETLYEVTAKDSFEWASTFDLAAGATEPGADVYDVGKGDLSAEEIVNTLTVAAGDVTAAATVSTRVWDLSAECEWQDGKLTGTEEYLPCRWVAESGTYTLEITSLSKKPIWAQVTVRDNVPGNWCGDGFSGRLTSAESPTVTMHFPEDGICEQGGAGGETMGVGTPGSYYLVAWGEISVAIVPSP
jgi:hypothetical protein